MQTVTLFITFQCIECAKMSDLVAEISTAEGIEQKEIKIRLKGSDTSGKNREIFYKIRKLPQHGVLYERNHKSPISRGELLTQSGKYPYDTSAIVKYVGVKDFFTMPYSNETFVEEYFEFAVVVSGEVESSPVMRQQINVINQNDKPKMHIPDYTKSLYTFSSLSWDSSGCYELEGETSEEGNNTTFSDNFNGTEELNFHGTSDFKFNRALTQLISGEEINSLKASSQRRNEQSATCPSRTNINGIQVLDADRNLDFVRVDISTSNGVITLNQNYLDKANFAICSNRSANGVEDVTWNCLGTGTGDLEVSIELLV